MRNLIYAEFKRNFRSLLLWTAIIVGLAGLMLIMFPAFEDVFSNIEDLLAAYPAEFLEVFGMGEGGLDMSNIYGWFGIEGYLFVTLIGGSYAAILGSSILSKEEDEHTIEFLLAKPISRTKILVGKCVVILLNLIIMNLVVSIILLIAFSVYGDLNIVVWLLYSFAPLLLQLYLAALALLASIFVTKSRKVISISLGLAIGLYVIMIISDLTDKAEFLKYITPYEYVNAKDIVTNHMIRPLYLGIALSVITVSVLTTWQLYKRKDITV
ncbi:MAG: ABC transporter permease [Candidatus Izimaplasma sp.]|nr:ABC transporter permease [Candidatus Izimaplasma bacterium]